MIVQAAAATTATPLLEALMLLLPAMYQQVKTAPATGLTEAQRIAYEPLVAAAAVVDKVNADKEGEPSMVDALRKFFAGAFIGRSGGAFMLAEICKPLFDAYLPSHSQLLAQTLTRLLQAGPVAWEEPLFLLVAYALQHAQAPSFVDHFHLVVQLCVDGESEANVYCLSHAMRAAAKGGDKLVSAAMASGKPFDEVANLKFYKSEEKELETIRDVLPAISHSLAALRQ